MTEINVDESRFGFRVGDLVRRANGNGETVWRVRDLGRTVWRGKYLLLETADPRQLRARSKPEHIRKASK